MKKSPNKDAPMPAALKDEIKENGKKVAEKEQEVVSSASVVSETDKVKEDES